MHRPDRISRREALARLSASALLALGLWPRRQAQGASAAPGRPFRFLAVNDLHHDTPACEDWFAALVRQMRTHERIDFVLLLGDLSDKGRLDSLTAIRRHFDTLGRPCYAQIGNHDYLTPSDRRAYEQTFPGRLNYWFRHRGWQFIGIDSTQGQEYRNTTIQPATLAWLDATLPKLEPRLPTVLFTHFPLGPGVPMTPLNAEDVLQCLLPFNLQAVLSGHYHAYSFRPFGMADVLTNRCCSLIRDNHDQSKEKGYWLCSADGGQLSRQFVQFQGPSRRQLPA